MGNKNNKKFNANNIVNNILEALEKDARKRLALDEYEQTSEALWEKWTPRFFGQGSPIARNPHIDSLCYRYGLLGYADKLISSSPDPSPLLWFEELPMTSKKEYKKSLKKQASKSKKFSKRHDELVERYAELARLNKQKGMIPDYERAARIEKSSKKCGFDVRETWNLDHVIPFRLYALISEFSEADIFHPVSFNSREEYEEKVLKPLLESLELQIIISQEEVFEPAYQEAVKDLSRDETLAVNDAFMERAAEAYYILGEHLPGMWW